MRQAAFGGEARSIPRFHLEGVEAGRVSVFRTDPDIGCASTGRSMLRSMGPEQIRGFALRAAVVGTDARKKRTSSQL
jgi:hypothetical protein